MHTAKERGQQQLESLGYDPIEQLVNVHKYLIKELQRQEDIRDGKLVELTSTGKVKAYRPEVHHALFNQMITIGEKLLRYGYSRVPEVSQVQQLNPVLQITLNEE
jgi:hypothetical protein